MWIRPMFAIALLAVTACPLGATLPPAEPDPTLPAATLAPSVPLNSPGYTVDATAPVAGYMGQFTLRAPAGNFTADGSEMLAIRVNELAAIA